MYLNQFQKEAFLTGLEQLGATILEPANEWEVVRYDLADRIHIVYRNRKGRITWTGESDNHYHLICDTGGQRGRAIA